jgi:hypothetical protein
MPFSNYGLEPERIEAMREAFDRVCNGGDRALIGESKKDAPAPAIHGPKT